MHGALRQTYNQARRFVTHHYRQGARFLSGLDRGLGTAYKIYRSLSPALDHALGDKAQGLHSSVSTLAQNYGNVRGKVQQADSMARSLASSVHKEVRKI